MIPRLFIETSLAENTAVPLTAEQAHYLKNVLRREEGDAVLLFNGKDGEFEGAIAELKKKSGLVEIKAQRRPQETGPDVVLCFAPVKRGPVETIVQKATEIGVAALSPVVTEHTAAPKLNVERLQSIAIEAAEQCGRLNVPIVSKPQKLSALLDLWPEDRTIIYCDEAGDDDTRAWGGEAGRAEPALDALSKLDSKTDKWAILIGPEGGFSPAERAHLRAKSFVTPITLGPRILRADTAAIAALVLWQAALGDWRRS